MKITEAEVRALRASVYGEVSDESWDKVKHKWMTEENIRWLKSPERLRINPDENPPTLR